ncbi:hypothetical protein E1B28_013554 [Marasmius oreades]|uniref:Uncharacterized protein n=1 Tax=Marasmius oreades TaxID=181124 RepID=A0A9P7UP50_9AGAR|nr:uncharacterized protein E1B28_013554 [Marasmius oreades]KAG7087601.1 hypothetical protein E1B28_013554 [Marasmius oreades]
MCCSMIGDMLVACMTCHGSEDIEIKRRPVLHSFFFCWMATSLNTVIVDDQDGKIIYSGQWSLAGSQTDYNRTANSPRSEGAQMSFTFFGTSVTAIGNLEPGARCNATFSVDGTPSNYISPPTNTTQRQQTIWTSPELSEGNHTLIYTAFPCTPQTNTTTANEYKSSISFDYLLYNTAEIPEAATIFIDDRDQRLRYSGNWSQDGGDGDFRLTRQGGGKGSSVQLAFTGSSIAVYGRVDNTSTVVEASFTVDGEKISAFAAGSHNSVSYNMEFFKNGSLTPTEHTLVISCLADGPFWLDYILLRSSPTDTTPKAGTIPVGAVVGSITGVLCLIGIGLVVWILYFRRRKKSPKNNTLTFPKRGLVRRITRYDSNTADPFSRDPIPVQAVPRAPMTPSVNMTPSITSYQSTAGLLATHSFDKRSLSDASSHHPAPESVHTDCYNTSHLDDDDDSVLNLPPEYATTAPSGTNIGDIVPAPSIPSSPSSIHYPYPPSRTNTFSTMHRRHGSIPSDIGGSDFSSIAHDHYPPTPSRGDSHYKPTGYTGASRLSRKSHGNARFVVNADDDARLSIADMKRRQQDVPHHIPIVHTDSGVRLPPNIVDDRDEHQNVPESSNGHPLLAHTHSEVSDPPIRPAALSERPTRPLPEPSLRSLDDDGQSIAALKRQQRMLIFSPDGFSTQTVPTDDGVHTDLPASTLYDVSGTPGPLVHASASNSIAPSEHAHAPLVPNRRPPQSTAFVDEVPPVYTLK